MNSHQDLLVWKKSMELAENVYRTTEQFSADERFNLTSQIRRSAVSIPSNIAEGHGRKRDGEFGQFLRVAYGSSSELETQIEIADRLDMFKKDEANKLLAELIEVRKMLNRLISTVSKR